MASNSQKDLPAGMYVNLQLQLFASCCYECEWILWMQHRYYRYCFWTFFLKFDLDRRVFVSLLKIYGL